MQDLIYPKSEKILDRRYLGNRLTDLRENSAMGPDFCKEYARVNVRNWSERFSPHFRNFFCNFIL